MGTGDAVKTSTYSMHGERQGLGLVCRGRPRLSYVTREHCRWAEYIGP
jgi:hypothetical protein